MRRPDWAASSMIIRMRREEEGFVIIDAMIAMLIMGVALLVLGLLINSTQRNQVRSTQRNQATLDLVEREVSAVRSKGWADVSIQSQPSGSCLSVSGDTKEWCSHRGRLDPLQSNPGSGGASALTAISTATIGRSTYDVYRYVYCLNASGAASSPSLDCPAKRVRIVVEAQGNGLARRLPPDGIAYRDLVMTQTLYQTPVS